METFHLDVKMEDGRGLGFARTLPQEVDTKNEL